MKGDVILRGLICGGEVSLAVEDTTRLVNEAIRIHGLSPLSAAALGRALTAAAYMCSSLKEERGALSLTIKGNGVGGTVCVSGDKALHMRGYIDEPHADLPPNAAGKLDVGGCIGREGTLTVVRDDGEAIPFVGTTELVSGEIGEDVAAYFAYSEQRPTAVAVGVKIGTDGRCLGAGGVFLQPMPGASEESIAFAEAQIAEFAAVSSLMEACTAEEVWRNFFGDPAAAESFYAQYPVYKCNCSRDYIEGLLASLGEEELASILREQGKIDVHCHYCNTDYEFTEEDVRRMLAARRKERNGAKDDTLRPE